MGGGRTVGHGPALELLFVETRRGLHEGWGDTGNKVVMVCDDQGGEGIATQLMGPCRAV